jgi:hypothetical protein
VDWDQSLDRKPILRMVDVCPDSVVTVMTGRYQVGKHIVQTVQGEEVDFCAQFYSHGQKLERELTLLVSLPSSNASG